MKRAVKAGCILLFLLMCAGVILFLRAFTAAEDSIFYLEWQSAAVVSADGEEVPFDPLASAPALGEGEAYRFATALPEREEELWLVFEVTGGALTVWVDGQEIFRSAAASRSLADGQGQVQLFVPAGGEAELVMEFCPLGAGPGIFPPLLRLTDDTQDLVGTIAFAASVSIPAGASALALVLVWGLFLVGVLFGRPDWSLIPLTLAACGLTVYRLAQGLGGYFLPPLLQSICSWQGIGLLTALALLVYLLMNRRRGFYRMLGRAALWSAGALLAAFLVSLCRGGVLSRYLVGVGADVVLYGFYDGLSYWLTLWLVAVCTLLSAAAMIRSIVRAQSQAHAAKVQYQLTLENYQQTADKNRRTAALRHEWKNEVAALHLLAQKGDLPALERRLEQLEGELAHLSTRNFSEHSAINAILQNAAYRAEEMGVDFHAQALVPGDLELDEGDLCALLLNMLDNALEAASKVEPPREREVRCRLKLTQGFLAVWCQNTYTGPLRLDGGGQPLTSKEDADSHGFGLGQMRAVAAKYQGIVSISHDGSRFTVETALKLP